MKQKQILSKTDKQTMKKKQQKPILPTGFKGFAGDLIWNF